jgi:hypothetical protein
MNTGECRRVSPRDVRTNGLHLTELIVSTWYLAEPPPLSPSFAYLIENYQDCSLPAVGSLSPTSAAPLALAVVTHKSRIAGA